MSKHLTVEPMMVASGNHEDMWGLWDDENFDRRVNYMLELIEGGHVFTKAEWLGGAGDPLFLYGAKARTPKRKKQLDSDEEPASKKSRVGGHNTRSVSEGADGEKFRELEARVDEVVADVALLREVCKKQEDVINSLKVSLNGKGNQKT